MHRFVLYPRVVLYEETKAFLLLTRLMQVESASSKLRNETYP